MKKTIRKHLFDLKEPKFKDFSSQLMPATQYQLLGVRIPRLRELAKEIVKKEWSVWFHEHTQNDFFEEVMLQGFVLGYAKMDKESYFDLLKTYIKRIDDWALCDCVCSTLKATNKWKDDTWHLITIYLKSKDEFEQRFAFIMLMDYFLDNSYINKTLDIIKICHPTKYYAVMGMAWLLATAFVKYPQQTELILLSNEISCECKLKAFQKIIESKRTSLEDRIRIRQEKEKLKTSIKK